MGFAGFEPPLPINELVQEKCTPISMIPAPADRAGGTGFDQGTVGDREDVFITLRLLVL